MTLALCFNCGATKFGAFCPCPQCEFASTGDRDLDIAFSDHRLSPDTLAAFGAVVASIRQVCDDEQLRFWSFIYYVSTRHPELLGVDLGKEQMDQCEAVVELANPPPVPVEESEEAKILGNVRAQRENSQPVSPGELPHD
jgi:hypothetical protein